MNYEIYCYGGIDIYRDVFNAIASLNGNSDFMKSLISISVIFGAFWSMIIMVSGDILKPFLSWMIPMTIVQSVFLTPTKTVHLIDIVYAGRHETIDNVPYGLALLAGTVSRISYQITQRIDSVFTIPNDMKYNSTGGIFAANLLAHQKIMTIQDENLSENMRSFIGNCVLYDLALGRKYTIKDLRHTTNIWGLISENASPARSFVWKENRNRGEIITCKEGALKFNQLWRTAIDQTACAVGAQIFPKHDRIMGSQEQNTCRSPLAKQEFIRFLDIHYGSMISSSARSSHILKQQMMISAMVDAQDHASVMSGNSTNFAVRKAYLQQRSHYEVIGKLFSDLVPILRACLELICYSIFLLIMPLLVLPQGYKILISWAQTVLWIAMWPPMYAILNMIMVSAISMKTKSYVGISNSEGITLASSLGVQNISTDMAAMAGYLSVSIPFICLSIVKGVSSFVHMSSSLSSVSQGAAIGASTEGLTGNYQMGNTSFDNHSLSNVSMLNEGYNGNLSSGGMKIQDGHVSIASSMEGGSSVATIEQSNLPISVNMAENIAQSKRIAASHEATMGQMESKNVEKSITSSIDHLGNLGKHLSSTTQHQLGWSEQQQHEVGTALQNVKSAIDKFAQQNNISTAQSATLLSSISTPLSGILPVKGNVSLESVSNDQSLFEKAKDFSRNEHLDETARTAEQAIHHISKNQTNDEAHSYLESHQASLNDAVRESKSAQAHFEKSQRFNMEADQVESQSATINKNMNDEFVSWLSEQHNPHGGSFGKKEALAMIAHKKEEADLYARQFVKEKMGSMSFSTSQESLKKDYEDTNLGISVDRNVVDQLNQESQKGISQDTQQATKGIENRIETKKQSIQEQMGKLDTKLEKDQKEFKEKFYEEKDRSGIAVATENSVESSLKTMKNAYKSISSSKSFVESQPAYFLTKIIIDNKQREKIENESLNLDDKSSKETNIEKLAG